MSKRKRKKARDKIQKKTGSNKFNKNFSRKHATLTNITSSDDLDFIDAEFEKETTSNDRNLIEHFKVHWQASDWQALVQLADNNLQGYSERSKLALMVASAFQQLNDIQNAKKWLKKASQWGCSKTLISQVMVAGVYSVLARTAVLNKDQARIDRYSNYISSISETDNSLQFNIQPIKQDKNLSEKKTDTNDFVELKKTISESFSSVNISKTENDDFYKAFEDKFRGSRELIKSRLKVYLPFAQKLSAIYPTKSVLDLGCGRGEWIELLRDHDIRAEGVDIDAGMLSECQNNGLITRQADLLESLKGLDDDSQLIVSAIHVVEHLSFADLKLLVKQALRVLVPGEF